MDINNLLAKLHSFERKALPNITKEIILSELAKKSSLKEIEATRAIQWLYNKKLVEIKSETKELISLDVNGKKYVNEGLPERRFLQAASRESNINEIQKLANLETDEVNICIGSLKKKAAIDVEKDGGLKIKLTDQGGKLLEKEFLEEQFLKKDFPITASELSSEEKFSFDNLIKRKKILKKETKKIKKVTITKLGKEVLKKGVSENDYIDRLTHEMLKKGSWKGKQFRSYDVSINVPKIFAGKRQPYSEFIEKVREKVVSMGFVEMNGPIIELELYNFDALYQPQNHPARTWSATYKIKEPKTGSLPEKKILQAIKSAHENGGSTGSTGWKYEWSEKIASQLVPRAHDTAISPRFLAKRVKIPGKYFSLVRCYRPDVIDSTHAVEFNQLGGFVVGKDLSFRDLLGLLKDFTIEMTGAKEVKFFPDYFPFTEPSVQISAKHPEFGWMELAGAGVFRPEMTEPLGIKEPVIAWGFGIDRLAMLKLGIEDIRDLFSQKLDFLRFCKKVL
ncbi:phenylalanine--tRNA ligase subunit alpha [Candidatus Woesearchaeota archaeon]|nr:phenylalanine--tRNA ligase subunit alpha [Candidatus Woesearchaeota archaeon]